MTKFDTIKNRHARRQVQTGAAMTVAPVVCDARGALNRRAADIAARTSAMRRYQRNSLPDRHGPDKAVAL